MPVGQAIAIAFAAVSTIILAVTFYLLRRTYINKMQEMARVLGVERQMVSELERSGQLPGALGLGRPVEISPKALEKLLECKSRGGQ